MQKSIKVTFVDNAIMAEERAICRFHDIAFSKKDASYETFYRMLSHQDLARIVSRLAKEIQSITYQTAETHG